jgi:hypothetical protein
MLAFIKYRDGLLQVDLIGYACPYDFERNPLMLEGKPTPLPTRGKQVVVFKVIEVVRQPSGIRQFEAPSGEVTLRQEQDEHIWEVVFVDDETGAAPNSGEEEKVA